MRVKNDKISRIVPATGKIYDINESDTNQHSVALPSTAPPKTRAMLVQRERVSGTGNIEIVSVPGTTGSQLGLFITAYNSSGTIWIRANDGLFYYAQTVANDDFDVYVIGYITGDL